MKNYIKIGALFVVFGLVPIFSVLAGETMKEFPGEIPRGHSKLNWVKYFGREATEN